MSKLTLDDLKKPAERQRMVDVPLPGGKTATFQGMLEGERVEWEMRNVGKKSREKHLRGLLIAASLENGDGHLMLTEDDVMADWWGKQDSRLVAAMFKYARQVNGFDDDEFDPEEAAKN